MATIILKVDSLYLACSPELGVVSYGQYQDEALNNLVEEIRKHKAASMSIKDYIDTIAPTPDWLKDIGTEAKRKDLNKLSMRQIDAEIAAARRERTTIAAPSKSAEADDT